MGRMLIENETKKSRIAVWVSHKVQCISFKETDNYEQSIFKDESEMWQQVLNLVDLNYLIQ